MRLLRGPTGGGCAMTSRELYDRVGGFQERTKEIFWLEDEAYIDDIQKLGFEPAVLADLRVHHTGGPYYATENKAKDRYWERRDRAKARRAAIKAVLFRLPFVRRLNDRFNWVSAPS